MQSFEYAGTWWLPSSPERKVTGKTSFSDNDRIILELEGLLEPIGPGILQFRHYPLILGQTQEGQSITLFDCFELGMEMRHGTQEYSEQETCMAAIAFIGTPFTDQHALRFRALDVCYSHLSQWAGVFPFYRKQHPFEPVRATTSKGSLTIQATRPLGQDLTGGFVTAAEIPQAVELRLEAPEALSLEEWMLQFVIPFQNFLTLATQRPNTLVSIHTSVLSDPQEQEDSQQTVSPVEIIFPEARQPVATAKEVFCYSSPFRIFSQNFWKIFFNILSEILPSF